MPSREQVSAAPSATWTMLLVATIVMSPPCALHVRDAERNRVLLFRHRALHLRSIILSSKKTTGLSSRMAAFNSPLASYGVDGTTTLRPGTWLTHACRLCECCAADRRVAPSVVRITIGTFQLAARHVVHLRGLVDQLVHDQRQEVAEHDVDDRPHAGHRRADADAREACLRDRRVDHALRPELLDEPEQHLERRAGLGHVLADHEDARIAPQLLAQRLVDRLAERQLANARSRLARWRLRR